MATITLQLSDELEAKLRTCPTDQGQEIESVALEVLRQGLALALPTTNSKKMPYEEWKREFDAWLKSRPKIDVTVDDSRETIYEGR